MFIAATIIVFLFRRFLFGWLIGDAGICALDAAVFTIAAALLFASPGALPWVSYILGVCCIWIALDEALGFTILMGKKNAEKK